MKDVNGYAIKAGQRVYVRARPCKMIPNSAPDALGGYPALVDEVDELFETIKLTELLSCHRRDATAEHVSIQEGVDRVESVRRQVLGDEKPDREVSLLHKHFQMFYKWQPDMLPRKRGLWKREETK